MYIPGGAPVRVPGRGGTFPAVPAFPMKSSRFTPHQPGAMSQLEKYDAIVIGAGQAGGPLSTALARAGKRTLLVERAHVGGTCINEGCTPTKTMVASARVAYLARRGGDYGVETGPVRVDLARVRERKRSHRRELPQRQPAPARGRRGPRPGLRRGALHGRLDSR